MGTKGRVALMLAADAGAISCLLFLPFLLRLSSLLSPVCMLRSATGLYCPFCGGTHAVMCLASGDFSGALRHNWLVVLLLVYLTALFVLLNFWVLARSKPARFGLRILLSAPAGILLGGLTLFFTVAVNVL